MSALPFAVLLAIYAVHTVQAEDIDYCKLDSRICTYHTFNTENYTLEQQSLVCVIQPLQYNETARDLQYDSNPQAEQKVSPTILNSTTVRCDLFETQYGKIKLQTADGQVLDTVVLFPDLCIICRTYDRRYCDFKEGGSIRNRGCYIDSWCYPRGMVNPKDPSKMCLLDELNRHNGAWSDVPEGWIRGRFADEYVRLYNNDICNLWDTDWPKHRRVRTPTVSGTEGLDLTQEGTSNTISTEMEYVYRLNFKIYMKFNPEHSGDTYTFFEIPSSVKMQHHQNGSLTVEYTFVDRFTNEHPRRVTLLEDEHATESRGQGNGIKVRRPSMRLNARRELSEWFRLKMYGQPSRNDQAESKLSYWTMFSFGYTYDGEKSDVSLYINGTQVPIDAGDTTGLYLRIVENLIFSNTYVSCMDVVLKAPPGFFTDTSLNACITEYGYSGGTPEESEEYFSSCEKSYRADLAENK